MAGKKRVYFRFNAPGAKEVVVLGSFNAWEARALKKDKKGIWSTWTTVTPGRYEYRYRVDGEWQTDPETASAPNEYGSENNVVIVN